MSRVSSSVRAARPAPHFETPGAPHGAAPEAARSYRRSLSLPLRPASHRRCIRQAPPLLQAQSLLANASDPPHMRGATYSETWLGPGRSREQYTISNSMENEALKRWIGSRIKLRGIAAALDERGIPAARGGSWSAVQVSRLLEMIGCP